ncbi:Flp pilus assembly protein CpaB [Nocardioides gansuensis]|uniref:Flp pilus assembly protein CpaB n=1 Tax=Nocardioides gansuensis TaxID=2138300 RepID=A0A2T8FAK4_9ACTN|nr:Flp pilus assembly protein CpaB [Nocardioides gansuensis]PVG82751.1 Flp pilus assembly protein CpaB [Nocardioides gansuensis]
MARRSVLLTVALVIAALGTAMIVLYVQGIDARAAEGQDLVEVLAATDVIDAGESVASAQAAGKFEKVEVRREDMVEGALGSISSIEDKVSLGTIFPQEQIISQKFGDPGSEEGLVIPDDKLAISVELTDPARVAGFVNPGSQVAIFVSADPVLLKPDGTEQKLAPYTRLLLPQVQVIGVGTTSMTAKTTTTEEGEQTTEQVPRTILTVAVDQEQAEKVIYGSRNGELSFALLSKESKVIDGRGITAADIMPEPFRTAR